MCYCVFTGSTILCHNLIRADAFIGPYMRTEAAMFYFGVDYFILVLKRLVRILEMAALASGAVTIILTMMAAMCS